jgi:hypothetical protein
VRARSCALTAVSRLLAAGMHREEQTVRQQRREWYDDVRHKRGSKRQALRVETCLAPWLGWVVSWWQGTQLVLAIDAMALGDRFVVLAVSVWSLAAVPCRPLGSCCPPTPNTPGGAHGCGGCGSCGPPSHGTGPSACWRIGACRPRGGCGGSSSWAGTRLCVSTPGVPFGQSWRWPFSL